MRIALVTNRESADLHSDGPFLVAAFARAGIDTKVVPWGAAVDWGGFDAALIRNTWDYVYDRSGFLAWADEVAVVTRLANPADVLRWNTDKRYLRELEASGIPIVPTVWVEAGDELPAVPWEDFVVKPSVSAGARLSARYAQHSDIAEHVAQIHARGAAVMVQPYVPSVDGAHETGTYVFGGAVSHAIKKDPVLEAVRTPIDDLSGGANQVVGPASVDPRIADFALEVLGQAPDVLYARVDTVRGADGELMLMELEVTEPFLFLEHAPEGADRFVNAVVRWLTSTSA